MSLSNRRRDLSPSRGGVGSSKLRMDRQPVVARITDPSLPIGKRKEIDNVMKKARAGSTNEYWDKKLLEAEEKDPNRWRHSGYKKMYIEDESSSGSANEDFRYNRNRSSHSRSRSRNRKTSPTSPIRRQEMRRQSPIQRRRSPRSPDQRRPRSPERRPRTPPSPTMLKRRTPPMKQRAIVPRSKRPPSPPPKGARTPSNSSVSSCSDDSCSVCSPKPKRGRSRSLSPSNTRPRHGPRSPPPKTARPPATVASITSKRVMSSNSHSLPTSSRAPQSRGVDDKQKLPPVKHRIEDKSVYQTEKALRTERNVVPRHVIESQAEMSTKHKSSRSGRSRSDVPEDPRLKVRPPIEPMEPLSKKSKEKSSSDKLRAKVKIEGEKRKKNESSESDSDSSENSLPTLTATTRLTLSERFGKMAQWKWSVDRSNLENMNMRITKDSSGGALKVMIEEGQQSPPRRYSYSPAPVGHFPEELATTAPTGLMSWDDVRVRYEYYKSRGYLRDLDLKDYVKWEEWWYRYQEWLKQERYYEFYERQQMHRRRRKKIPISQRLN